MLTNTNCTTWALTCLLLINFCIQTVAQTSPAERQTAQSWTSSVVAPGEKFGYWEYLPEGYNDPGKTFPIVLFLHGVGEKGSDLNRVLVAGPPRLIRNGKNFPFICISPQARYPWDWNPVFVDELLTWMINNYKVDKTRVYVTGLSMGGNGTWDYAAYGNHSSKLAAIVPIAGWLTGDGCNLQSLPTWAFVGEYDGSGSPNTGTEKGFERIYRCGTPDPEPLLTIYPGRGHDAWTPAYNDDNMWAWLLAQRLGSPPNLPPTVDVGKDFSITLPTNSTTLTARASDPDGSISSYLWTKVSGPAAFLDGTSKANLTVRDLVEGQYTFRCKVTDNKGASASDDIVITVIAEEVNKSPTANAGQDITINLPAQNITINGSGSDPDGQIVSYRWDKISGPNITLNDQDKPSLLLTDLVAGTFDFRLTVTDDDGATGSDVVRVIINPEDVNQNPVANAGPDKEISLPTNSVTLFGQGSDPDGRIVAFKWEKVSGPTATLVNTSNPNLTVENLVAGIYQFSLTVTDDDGATASDLVNVSVTGTNRTPEVDAGSDKTVTLPTNTIVLIANANDPDGKIVLYHWEQLSGPNTAGLANYETAEVTVNNLIEGSYTFMITVEDDQGASASDEVVVVVKNPPTNIPPKVNAGPDLQIQLPENSITITATATDDDGLIVSTIWEKLSGPTVTISGENTTELVLTNLVEGQYEFKISVTDDSDATVSDRVKLTVFPEETNKAPTVNAGPDKFLTLPNNTTTIAASANDTDGEIASYLWTKIQGPNATISGAQSANLSLSDLVEGIYVFEIVVEDNDGASASDRIRVTVGAANIPPTVNIGNDRTITLPEDSVIFNPTVVDNDGTIETYQWVKVSGPSANLTNGNQKNLKVINMVEGTYIFSLTVTDNENAQATDEVTVTVLPEIANKRPTVTAEDDKIIYLPTNSTTLSSNAKDSDGTIISYLWTKVSGPQATLKNINQATATVEGLEEGIYKFRITVTDNDAASASDDIIVEVRSTNKAPVASAGPDQSITLPTNSITLNGKGSDSDGSIASYTWDKISGPSLNFQNRNSANVTLTNLVAGTYTLRLTVVDDDGAEDSDNVKVEVLPEEINQPPTVSAGANKTITLPKNNITLNANASDNDGQIATYLWRKISGPASDLSGTNSARLEVTNMLEGRYVFRITVTDDDGAGASDDVVVVVNPEDVNQTPVANAGPNKSITLPVNSITLNGSGSDPDGSIVAYQWTKVSGPAATLQNQNTANLTVRDMKEGDYTFRLKVTDDDGATSSDQVKVIVLPEEINNPPIVNAGNDKIIYLPQNSIKINGTSSDSDGNIESRLWTQVSGPNTAIITGENTNSITISELDSGVYVFNFRVTDNDGAEANDRVKVTVRPEIANKPPTVDAGDDKMVRLPTNTLTLTGSVNDEDGQVVAVRWTKLNGPTVTVSNRDSIAINISDLKAGTYSFELAATDDDGAITKDVVIVSVLAETINYPPTVDAGSDQYYTIPISEIIINGTVEDDGEIDLITWEQVSGPEITLDGINTPTLTLSSLVPGNYTFTLIAVDVEGATGTDQVNITILAEREKLPPIIDAGADTTIIFPQRNLNVFGSAYDPVNENEIISYSWRQVAGPPTTILYPDSSVLRLEQLLAGEYIFELTAANEDGLSSKDEVIINVYATEYDKIKAPDYFSPNNDGIADFWILENFADISSKFYLSVFDKSGDIVYESQNYQNNWNGTANGGGRDLPEGVYFFTLSINGAVVKTGSITLLR
ncbi:PKD domain-containing protein [Marinigracilibium pacificum]|uniref:PKD domain-containing protein n=1 Tax=Marinigracilibium pacificum TaxID=2729599 RepID=A0A848IU34_9BACT|nr:PKD domain-containing protein [Marinigracilibium pacificum]NMM47246.1 PKD domain-containing protein [Marinigracilibium pacificum]